MNKAVKGALVGAAGIALLGGGFGTFATWTDEATIDAGTVRSGKLELSAGDPTWHAGSNESAALVTEATGLEDGQIVMVPGDTFTLKQPLDVVAVGDSLKAEMTVNWPGAGAVGPGVDVTVHYAGKEYHTPNAAPEWTWRTPEEMKALRDAEFATVTFRYDHDASEQTGWALNMDRTVVTLTQVP